MPQKLGKYSGAMRQGLAALQTIRSDTLEKILKRLK
jgi:hypothetical protein